MKPAILIVDDYLDMLTFLKNKLQIHYEILSSTNAKSALEILQTEIVHLVISDVMMPEMDGFELCTKIKSSFDTCHIPIILLTAKGSLEARIDGLECGADAYIEKPFSPKHLELQISNLLLNRHKLKEFFATSPLALVKSVTHVKADEIFLEQLNAAIQKNIQFQEFNIEQLAKEVNMSRATLFRKTKGITNLTPNEFITITRLKKAASLLSEGSYKMYEIAEMVGFVSQSHFARIFLKQFQMTPTDFLSKCRLNETKN